MKRGVLSSTVSITRRLLARRLEPVSVTSTIASASSGGFTSVAPHENSTSADTPCLRRYCLVRFTTSVAIRLPARSAGGGVAAPPLPPPPPPAGVWLGPRPRRAAPPLLTRPGPGRR